MTHPPRFFFGELEDTDGVSAHPTDGVSAHPISVLSGSVVSYLIYADVRLHIPMTHRNARST